MRSAVSLPLGMALVPVIWAVPLYCAVHVPAMAVPAGDTVTRMQRCPAGSPLTVRSIRVTDPGRGIDGLEAGPGRVGGEHGDDGDDRGRDGHPRDGPPAPHHLVPWSMPWFRREPGQWRARGHAVTGAEPVKPVTDRCEISVVGPAAGTAAQVPPHPAGLGRAEGTHDVRANLAMPLGACLAHRGSFPLYLIRRAVRQCPGHRSARVLSSRAGCSDLRSHRHSLAGRPRPASRSW